MIRCYIHLQMILFMCVPHHLKYISPVGVHRSSRIYFNRIISIIIIYYEYIQIVPVSIIQIIPYSWLTSYISGIKLCDHFSLTFETKFWLTFAFGFFIPVRQLNLNGDQSTALTPFQRAFKAQHAHLEVAGGEEHFKTSDIWKAQEFARPYFFHRKINPKVINAEN